MEPKIVTRMGDGSRIEMTPSEIRADVEDGVAAAVKRAKVPPLTADEIDHLVDIFTSTARFASVDVGDEVILSSDGTCSIGAGSTVENLLIYQNSLGADILELGAADYSYKAVKTIVTTEAQRMQDGAAQHRRAAPVRRDARPRVATRSPTARSPTGRSCCRSARSTRRGRRRKRRSSWRSTTCCSSATISGRPAPTAWTSTPPAPRGDADLLATLRVVETLRERYPDIGLQVGMASEMVLGMHGELEYKGRRLAGMWPHEQVRWPRRPGRRSSDPRSTSTRPGRSPGTRPRLHVDQAVHGRRADPDAPQRRHGRLRRADDRLPAARCRVASRSSHGRHPQDRRVVDGCR